MPVDPTKPTHQIKVLDLGDIHGDCLPEVALVAILDADKEGFLRNVRSLTQIAGRAARHSRARSRSTWSRAARQTPLRRPSGRPLPRAVSSPAAAR